jgi:SRSO17 transposase
MLGPGAEQPGGESAAQLEEQRAQAWAADLTALHARIAPRFRRAEPRRRALAYLRGLLSPVERKNGWQLAEEAGEATPDGMQRLLAAADWDVDAVRDDLRAYVVEQLGDPAGVLVVDETGFLKKGIHSAGVQRQYSGTAGRTENCQLGVFLVYATAWGPTYLDRDLYLPRSWTDDRERCRAAGIPDEVGFQTKPALAQQQLQRALDGQVPCAWVTADCVYGADPTLRRWLEGRPQAYVLAIRKDTYLAVAHPTGVWRESVQTLAARLPADAWQRLSAGAGSKGPRWYDWAQVPLAEPAPAGWALWLLVRRSLGERPELAYYRVFAPAATTLAEQVRVAGTRWTVEECFETGKDEVGLDHYEVRKWGSWYRHMTLALLAHAYLAVLRAHAVATPAEKGGLRRQRTCCR